MVDGSSPPSISKVEDKKADEDDHDVPHGSASSLLHPESQDECGSSHHGEQHPQGTRQQQGFPTNLCRAESQ